jgi:hypothetical protein
VVLHLHNCQVRKGLGTRERGLGKKKTSTAPSARFLGYFSRKGAKDAKDAKRREVKSEKGAGSREWGILGDCHLDAILRRLTGAICAGIYKKAFFTCNFQWKMIIFYTGVRY